VLNHINTELAMKKRGTADGELEPRVIGTIPMIKKPNPTRR
jgi:hypothetical protein